MTNLIQIHMAGAETAGFEQLGRSRALVAQARDAREQDAVEPRQEVAIRRAGDEDLPALIDLALMDGDRDVRESLVDAAHRGQVLVADVDGAIGAAISLESGRLVADPFVPSAAVGGLLHMRARQIATALRLRHGHRGRVARRAA